MTKILFTVPPYEKDTWVRLASARGLTLSEWLRQAARKEAELSAPTSPTPTLLDERVQDVFPDLPVGVSVQQAPTPLKPFRADPKTKASQEHGKKERKTAEKMCVHRVPLGSFCKRCAES